MNEFEVAKEVVKMIESIDSNGTTVIVGGAVRDIIMGKTPNDVDIATSISIDKIETVFNSHDIGKNKDFGIVVINHKGFDFEIANFRTDGEYTDGRRPDSVEIVESFEEDSNRRDFTINAMGMTSNGDFIDFHGGMKDIENKIIRTVGSAEKRFSEDYIRILRAIRFAARFDFTIADECVEAIKANAHKMMQHVSVERVWNEITKMAESKNFWKAVEMMYDFGVMEHVFPEMAGMGDFKQNPKYHPEGAMVRKKV